MKLIDTNIDNNMISKITKVCKIHNESLTAKEKDSLTIYGSIISNFNGLQKIHKSKQIKKIPNSDLKFRPILARPSYPTSRLSKLMDILLHPFQNKMKSYIRDSIDFLNSIPEKIDSNTLIVTIDDTNICSNILPELGKQAISFWIDKFPHINVL